MTDHLATDLMGRPLESVTDMSIVRLLQSGHVGAIATSACRAAQAGRAEQLLLAGVTELIRHDAAGLDGALVAAVACLRVLPEHEGVRGALPVARALDVIAAAVSAGRVRDVSAGGEPLSVDGLAALLGAVDVTPLASGAANAAAAEQVEVAVRRAAAGGAETAVIAAAVVDMLYENAASCAHLAPIVVAGLLFARLAERAVAVDTLARLARTLVVRALTPRAGRQALITPVLGAAARIHASQDQAKAAAFQEARFRPHLLAAKPSALVRAVAKALAFGVPRARVASSLCLAAAERTLRFDPSHARNPRRRETWVDMGWLLQVAEAVRALGVLHDRPQWLRLLLHTALLVRAAQPLDAATPLELPEPETLARTWDHGPEIARVTGAMLQGDGQRAMAALRGYLMMVLPEQPLSAEIAAAALEDRASSAVEQGATVATVVAALASFGAASALPHRDLLPCAAIHIFTSPQPPRALYALTHAAIDQAEGATANRATSPLPWLA